MQHECFQDKNVPGQWRVEAFDLENEGECYVTIFPGSKGQERAHEYAAWKNAAIEPVNDIARRFGQRTPAGASH
jgi:hypothetical protein